MCISLCACVCVCVRVRVWLCSWAGMNRPCFYGLAIDWTLFCLSLKREKRTKRTEIVTESKKRQRKVKGHHIFDTVLGPVKRSQAPVVGISIMILKDFPWRPSCRWVSLSLLLIPPPLYVGPGLLLMSLLSPFYSPVFDSDKYMDYQPGGFLLNIWLMWAFMPVL